LFQGRKTYKELSKAGIRVTMILDNAVGSVIANEKISVFIIGADALLKNGDIINKIGSNMFAEIAHSHKIPVYVVADSWKFSKRPVKIEERAHQEVWKNAPKNIRINNPAFEKVDSKYITAIVSELGILKPREFAKRMI
jgi:translation initiation factor 2B subunit (eIF-2B alpha/beta/delta family)